ncbi:MAG: hypothetical protein POG24_12085 [Acidocella sp.]|nr:hypothetical protein [Acidocella sp.]
MKMQITSAYAIRVYGLYDDTFDAKSHAKKMAVFAPTSTIIRMILARTVACSNPMRSVTPTFRAKVEAGTVPPSFVSNFDNKDSISGLAF